MKKFLLRAFLPLLIFLYTGLFPSHAALPTIAAAASAAPTTGSYACILTDAYFYAEPSEKHGLFLLPKTYYVKLLEYGADYSKIEYLSDSAHTQSLVGYAKTSALTFVDYVPARPFLYYLVDVKYRIEDAAPNDSASLTELTVTCAYYGDYPIGSELWCYILRDGEFGYIPKPADLSYEQNTEYADRQQGESSASESAPDGNGKSSANPIQIAILIAVCLLIPLLAALILKPPRRPPYETEE